LFQTEDKGIAKQTTIAVAVMTTVAEISNSKYTGYGYCDNLQKRDLNE
jgi:hypothetical protein